MAGIETLADQILRPDRRRLLAGLGAAVFASRILPPVAAQTQPGLALHARIDPQSEYPVKPDVLTWLVNGARQEAPHFTAGGDSPEFTLSNDLPVPVALHWRGVDGLSAAEPL